jgi:hypothetical protein
MSNLALNQDLDLKQRSVRDNLCAQDPGSEPTTNLSYQQVSSTGRNPTVTLRGGWKVGLTESPLPLQPPGVHGSGCAAGTC